MTVVQRAVLDLERGVFDAVAASQHRLRGGQPSMISTVKPDENTSAPAVPAARVADRTMPVAHTHQQLPLD